MAHDPSTVAALLVDPYNDFFGDGGKLWSRVIDAPIGFQPGGDVRRAAHQRPELCAAGLRDGVDQQPSGARPPPAVCGGPNGVASEWRTGRWGWPSSPNSRWCTVPEFPTG